MNSPAILLFKKSAGLGIGLCQFRDFFKRKPGYIRYFFESNSVGISPVPHGTYITSRYLVCRQLCPLGLSPKVRDIPDTQKSWGLIPSLLLP